MRGDRREVLAILGRALAWLPACVLAWHLASPVLSWIPARLAASAVGATVGELRGASLSATHAAIDLAIALPYRPGTAGGDALVTVEVNPRLYTFGIALFLALSLALPRPWRLRPLAVGAAVLLVLPAWGIAFDALKQLATAAQLSPVLRWPAAGKEAVALGYQVGALLLPTLAPVALWLAGHPEVVSPQALRTLDSSGA